MLLTGKFGAVLASIPLPIVAALYCVLFAYVGMYLVYIFIKKKAELVSSELLQSQHHLILY